ncbi:MAG: hypothetical protein JRG74_08855 [Deltaproteobacteria bacterium]|nr:hypothetical protein [Deltaproteobacteria bacterium]MBW2166187.1 hypothetical protein [Deltaproteobacteria bacterium]
MKRFICMFFVVIMCLGFVGCKEEESSPPAKTEKTTPRVEETIPPVETLPAPVETQPQGEQEGGGDVSHDNQ